MKLNSSNANSFELKIIGYEFPEIKNDYYDSNWLMVQIDIVSSQGIWNATFPALLTFEVEQLANWLNSIDSIKDDPQGCALIEPYLDFQFTTKANGQQFLNVSLGMEMLPNWVTSNEFEIEFPVHEIDLPQIAKDLRLELERFPQRVFR
jgi:hypothetical protein